MNNYDLQGTCYFVSHIDAIFYYASQDVDAAGVDYKIQEKEIHIGKPPARDGYKVIRIDSGRRYAYEKKS